MRIDLTNKYTDNQMNTDYIDEHTHSYSIRVAMYIHKHLYINMCTYAVCAIMFVFFVLY